MGARRTLRMMKDLARFDILGRFARCLYMRYMVSLQRKEDVVLCT
jgi:hypothetical protein